jgi:antitoxin component HigA of HigAB toxin-antitoxin module
VFFSQFEHAVQQQIDQVAADLCARTATQYRITIKPHPREINAEQIYGRAIAAGAQLLSSDHNSYRLLEEIDVAVTVYSTLAVETLAYPCRSIVLQSPDWSEAIHSLLAEHYLERADDAEQLAELLKIAPAIRDRSEIARRLFGIGEPTLDFASLIERQITALE